MNQGNNKMRFEELLVPYVQDRLDASERQYVEELANSDRELNEKLQFEIQLASSIQQSDIEFKEVTPSFRKLKQQIESRSNWWSFFSWDSNSITGGFNPGLVVATLAVVSVGIYMLFSQNAVNLLEDGYETLSNGESEIVYEHDKQYLRVIIAERLTESEIQSLSNEFIFNIESGPDSLNSYIISIAEGDALSVDALQNWRSDPRFLLIEPILSVNTKN